MPSRYCLLSAEHRGKGPFDAVQVGTAQQRQDRNEPLRLEIPPAQAQKNIDQLVVKPLLDETRGIAAHNTIWFHIPCNDCACGNDRAVADFDPGHG